MSKNTLRVEPPGKRVPRVGVIIVTWNRRDFVVALLDSLRAAPYPNLDILVVDNASSDGTAEWIHERYPEVACIRTRENLGGTGGFNAGLWWRYRQRAHDYLWLLDNDVVVEPGALEILVDTLESHPDAAVAGSQMILMDDPKSTNEIGGFFDFSHGWIVLHQGHTPSWSHRNEVYDVDYVAACSLLVRARLAESVGLWDDLFLHLDDVDWCLRFRKAGYRVLACAASRIRHVSANAKRVTWVVYYDTRNRLHLMEKYCRPSLGSYVVDALRTLLCSMRDEVAGKGLYGQLNRLAFFDFLHGRMGCRTGLMEKVPTFSDQPLGRVLANRGVRHVWTLEPLCRDVLTDAPPSIRRTAVCHEAGVGAGSLPPSTPRMLLPQQRSRRLWILLRHAILGPRADVLVLNFDHPCGLLSFCAHQMILLGDRGWIESPGGWRSVWRALRLPFKWLAFPVALLRFMWSRNHAPSTGAITVPMWDRTMRAQGIAAPLSRLRSSDDLGRHSAK